MVASGTSFHTEYFSKVLNQWHQLRIFPKDGDQFDVLFTNVTERKHTEEALRESETRYCVQLEREIAARTAESNSAKDTLQTMVDTMVEAVSTYDVQGRVVQGNRQRLRCSDSIRSTITRRSSKGGPGSSTWMARPSPEKPCASSECYRYVNALGQESIIDASVTPLWERTTWRGAVSKADLKLPRIEHC